MGALDRPVEGVVLLSRDQAQDLTDRIKETLSVAHELIIAAFQGRAWEALDYDSWDAYCVSEFEGARMIRLPRDQRREIVSDLRQAGMSTRAIGSGLGTPQRTIADDVATERIRSVGPARITSLDGRERPATQPARLSGGVSAEAGRGTPQSRGPRTDVVGTMASVLGRMDDAAELARKIKPSHLKGKSDAAGVWLRRLEPLVTEMNDLLELLKEEL